MPGVVPKFESGPVTYEVAEPVVGGQLIEGRSAGLVGVAVANSTRVLGVATTDGRPFNETDTYGTTTYGATVMDMSVPDQYVAVGVGYYPVTYATDAALGDRLTAAANGQVAVGGTGPTVGFCAEPNGATTGSVALARILV